MKKMIYILIGIFFTANLFAQIPNSDFESWTLNGGGNLNPDYWLSPNDQSIGYTPVVQATGYSGSTYAMRVYTPNMGGFNVPAATLLSFANTQRPVSLTGVYKGTFTSGDSSYINVTLSENGNGVGAGVKYFSQNQGTFTPFSIPINYSNANIPDTMTIIVGSGFGAPSTPGAELIIDQLGFNVSGVETHTSDMIYSVGYNSQWNAVMLHLNSAFNETLQLDLVSMSGQIISQREFFASTGESLISVPMDINPGIYIIRITGTQLNYNQKILINQ